MPNYPDLALEPIAEEEDKDEALGTSQKFESDIEEMKSQGSFSARFRERMKTNIANV